MIVTRFAPSPTGYLHLGHAYAALFAWNCAQTQKGRFLLRIEDIDATRCKPEFTEAIFTDLAWLGLSWEQPARLQSSHMDDYQAALDRLANMGLLYPCFCTRKDIAAEILHAGAAPHGPDGPLYPGICRHMDPGLRAERIARNDPHALRLDVTAALARINGPLTWQDRERGMFSAQPEIFGDVVLARKDFPTSYHLAVTVDDALQGITLVTRGEDLLPATHVHRLLQALLGLPTPAYHHHSLRTDAQGRRLAKRDKAETLTALREVGLSPDVVRQMAMGQTD